MKNIELHQLVKLINPAPGEEELIYEVVNINEANDRCYIEPINLHNWNKALLPQELVSIYDLTSVERLT